MGLNRHDFSSKYSLPVEGDVAAVRSDTLNLFICFTSRIGNDKDIIGIS